MSHITWSVFPLFAGPLESLALALIVIYSLMFNSHRHEPHFSFYWLDPLTVSLVGLMIDFNTL